jgi:hypothetical protein
MKRNPDFLLQRVGDQDLLVPLGRRVLDMNAVITLNPAGRLLWELLAEDRSVECLATEVAKHFGIDADRARADVLAFLDELGRIGLLKT